MSLSAYNQKRNFKKTEEPKGKEKSTRGSLRFVVQKHDASGLHYDFRLEMDGVLKSWAVPKGPSLNPADKRLAMMVEDHPLDYRDFEGVIPAGEYGGGTVIVWDEGTYERADANGLSRKKSEAALLEGLQKGRISFTLHGKKLRGAFTLMQMRGKGERTWLLVKKKDAFSSEDAIIQNDRSVKSGKTLAKVAAENGVEVNHPEAPKAKTGAKQATKSNSGTGSKTTNNKLQATNGSTAAGSLHPQTLQPMMATLINEPFDDKDWLFEIKWDGYRAVAYCNGKDVSLVSRNQQPFTNKYKPVAEALQALKLKAVFDGEIVAVDGKGAVNFQLLQNWQNTPARLQYFVFDLLWADGKDLTHLPLIQRKSLLNKLLPAGNDVIKYSDHVMGKGNVFFGQALKKGLEGIMAKKAHSVYVPGTRTEDWVKIKVAKRQEVIIAGYTEPRRSRKFFGSLLLGVYDGKDLVYIGHTGSGFTAKTLEEIYKELQPLKTAHSPFAVAPKANMPATWVRPKLVCEIKFTEWTGDRIARHPIFMGLRTDKKAGDVTFEKATTMAKLKSAGKKSAKVTTKKATAQTRKGRNGKLKTPGEQIDVDADNEREILLNNHTIQLTNLQKVYFPEEGFRKGDAVNYYGKMAPYILPYLLRRPQSLHRHPNGIAAPGFFQKDVRGKVPEWMETVEEFSESTNVTVEYLVCSNEATLIYMANLGCIEINPWHTRKAFMLQPDWCLIDLDPHTGNSFDEVMEVARVTKKVLDAIAAEACIKTSGSSGIHIYIPLGAKYGFDQSRSLAEAIVTAVNAELPRLTSLERNPTKRKNKIYLDFLQNSETQTAAAPYSLRPKPGMPVSTPLDWSELKKGLTQKTWNANNIFDRVKTEGDLFKRVLGKGINLEKVMKNIERMNLPTGQAGK